MQIFILRHEEKTNTGYDGDTNFRCALTDAGKGRASWDLKQLIEQHGITKIYSSPFVRTLQTVAPYAGAHGLPIHTDWRLVECLAHTRDKDKTTRFANDPRQHFAGWFESEVLRSLSYPPTWRRALIAHPTGGCGTA